MLKSEMGQLVFWMQGVDGRVLNEQSIEAWHQIVGHFNYEDALTVVQEHYRVSTRKLMPADILTALDSDWATGPLRDATAELQAEQKQAWCSERGITIEAYDDAAGRGDIVWLVALGRGELKAVERG